MFSDSLVFHQVVNDLGINEAFEYEVTEGYF